MTSETTQCSQCGAETQNHQSLCESCQTDVTLVSGQGFADGTASIPGSGADFGDYELLEEIGRGGMGVVFRARHSKLDRIVALKVILGGKFSSDSDRQRFHFEAQAAAKLDHPAIIPVYDIAETEEQPYFAMKYVSGGSLTDQLPQLRTDLPRAMSILSQIARAVHHAHQRGILHRDLKPDNILLDENGSPLLTDLGLAKQTSGSSGITQTGALLGTPRHMAPEQAEPGQQVTTAADIYALGTIVYQLLTGRTPHVGETAMETVMLILQEPVVAPSSLVPKLDPALELICMKCLERQPADRYGSAAELADDLERWQRREPISVRPPGIVAQVSGWMRRNRALVYAGMVFLAAALLSFPLFLSVLSALPSPDRLYEGSTADPTPWLFRLSSKLTLGGAFFGPLLLFIWMILGLLIVVVARPPTLRKASFYGLVAGAASGAFMLTLLGWAIFSVSSQARTNNVIRKLATVSLSSQDEEAQKAMSELEATYPLLSTVPDNQRVNYVADRIFADGISAGPQILAATVVGLLIMVLPIILGAMIGWSLHRRQHRWWVLVIRYGACQIAMFVIVLMVIAMFTDGNINGQKVDELPLSTLALSLAIPCFVLALLLRQWKKSAGEGQ